MLKNSISDLPECGRSGVIETQDIINVGNGGKDERSKKGNLSLPA
jgi:hypothetical protein